MTSAHTNPTPHNNELRLALEDLWGCGAGEMIIGEVPDYVTGEAMPAPVAQLCRSNAHNHAYWDGTCEFAHHTANALAPLVAARVAAARTQALAPISALADEWQSLADNPDASPATQLRYALHAAALHAVLSSGAAGTGNTP